MNPYDKIDLGRDSSGRSLVINRRTRDMLAAVERKLGIKLTIVQGSYRAGSGAAASAGTHDGGGVVDIRTWDLPANVSPQLVVKHLRLVGFAAWYRTKIQGFDPHIHAVAIADRDLAPVAARQVDSYRAGRNGLASNGADDGPRVPIRTWEQVVAAANPQQAPSATAAPAPAGQPTKPSTKRPVLKRGSRGKAVGLVQRLLGIKPEDGIFGPKTEAGVKDYQRMRGLLADGVIGPVTWSHLEKMLG